MSRKLPIVTSVPTKMRLIGLYWSSLFQPLDFRLRVIARMKTLQVLDNIEISESEATAALRLAAGSRVSSVSSQFNKNYNGTSCLLALIRVIAKLTVFFCTFIRIKCW